MERLSQLRDAHHCVKRYSVAAGLNAVRPDARRPTGFQDRHCLN